MVVGQITAGQDQIDILKFFIGVFLKQLRIDPIADGEYL